MRLTVKLTLVLMLVIVVFMSVQAVRNTRRLTALHLTEMRDELVTLAGTLGTAVAEIYRTSGPSLAAEYIRQESERREGEPELRLRSGAGAQAIPAGELAQRCVAERCDMLDSQADALVVTVGVGTKEWPAALELRHSLDTHRQYTSDVIEQQVVSTAVLSLLCAMALLVLGLIFIGQPVRLLVDQARTVADGDFSLRVAVRQSDEIGILTREMNRMSDRLEAAWNQVQEERRARTAALAELRHADRLSTVGKIASGIAHELGTPLNVVSGRAMMIASAEGCSREIAADANIIVEQANHMTQIIRQLLAFSRRNILQRHDTDLHELIEHASLLVEPLADEHGVSIQIADEPGIKAAIDEGKALQVLTNLMINGIQAMPGGGVLRLEVSSERVRCPPEDHALPGNYVCVAISDEGVGIDAGALEHIFEPFFTTKGEGTGLGLSVCHGIVKEHGGFIAVASAPGRGSRFSVYFPQGDDL